MSTAAKISIIICTCNRANHLYQTLLSFNELNVPAGMSVELIIVDNGSKDHTRQIIEQCRLPAMTIRYLQEPKPGKSHGLNAGLAATDSDIILFTDDDVRLSPTWLEGMCAPILSGEAHAVSGGILMAPNLKRNWMGPTHRRWLASTEDVTSDDLENPFLIGANMAFSSMILKDISDFDTELGPGALGFAEDILFTLQAKQAGYKIVGIMDVIVEHHFDETRLLRRSFVERVEREGRAAAYLAHHWHHQKIRCPEIRLLKHLVQLTLLRIMTGKSDSSDEEGCPLWEMRLAQKVSFYRHYMIERRRAQNYEKGGCVKLRHD